MAWVTLVEASPWVVSTGAAQPVRLAGGGSRAYDHLGFADWRAGIVEFPKFKGELGFTEDGWSGATMAQNGDVVFAARDIATLTSLSALFWNGCPITIKTGDDAAASPSWSTEFTGTVANAGIEDGKLKLAVVDNSKKLDVPAVSARFAGSGGIEGDSGVEGRLKRRSIGMCWNVECSSLLAAYNIYEVGDPAFPLSAIVNVKDIGRSASSIVVLPWQGTIAGTLAALIAAVVPQGGAVVAPSIACLKWWTQGVLLTADIRGEIGSGYVDKVAAIAGRLAGIGGVSVSNVVAMEVARPAEAGLHLGNDAETLAGALDRLLLGASLNWYLGADGTITIGQWSFDQAPAATLRSVKVTRTVTHPPTRSRRVGYRRNERIHAAGEIAATILAQDVVYSDGRSVDSLQPDEPGATRGAPEGTYVADKLAEEVIAEALATMEILQAERENMSKLLAGFLSAMQLAETREARAQALGFIDGEGIRTAHRREVTERVEGQTAIVTDLNLIGARSEDGSAYILNLGTVKVSPTETFGERLEEIGATFEAQDGLITSNYSALATAISNETAARTTAIETLNASIETLDGETAASIATVQDAIADEAGVRATAITSVQASITGLTNSTNASVSSLNTAIANESSTRASALSSVNSTLGSHTSSITSLNSSVSSLNSTVASNYSALTATIGGLNTTVTTQSSAIATLQGRTGAFWSVVANTSSGATAFISARVETSGGSVTSNVAFGANEVHISNPSSGSGWTKVLSVSGGNVQIFGNLSATGSVSTPNLISNSVTKTVAALRGSNLTGSGGFVGIDAEAMITLAYAAEVIVLYTGFQNYTSTIPQYQSRLILYNASHSPIDSRVGPSGGAGSYETNFSFMAKFSLSAGTYYVEPQWLGGDSGIYLNAGSGVICLITYR